MSQTLKEQMIENVKKGDDVIQGIKDDQLLIVSNYVKKTYGIEPKSRCFIGENKVQIHHITFTDSGKKINLHYQKLNHNNTPVGIIFTTLLHNNLKIELINVS